MRVNSVFTSFFTRRLAVRCRMAIVMCAMFFMASSFTTYSDRDLRVKEMNVIIRQIGHRILLQAGDSTSRVLPVTEVKEGTFLLRFENEFAFSHDSLVELSLALLPKKEFPSGYIVTVQDCRQANIVYGFQVNAETDVLPCQGRTEFPGCYTIEFAFHDFYANAETINTERLAHKPKPVKADRNEAKPKSEEVKAETDVDRLAGELKSFKAASGKATPETKEFKTTTADHPLVDPVYSGGMLMLLGIVLLTGLFWKLPATAPIQNKNNATAEEPVQESVPLGRFLFDVKGQRLLFGNEVISLTDKECRVLELLSDNFGELVSRETLTQKIWISEGVITGRSLDMFVSKLRKKLGGDPELRISNVHGRGYKLEIAGM